MIRQVFTIDGKWTVIVYYNIDYKYFKDIWNDLQENGCKEVEIHSLYNSMVSGMAMGFTYSNTDDRISIVGLNRHYSKAEYISTIVHEAEHVKDDMFRYYNAKNEGEPPAYAIGYIVKKMYKVFKNLLG